MFNVLTYYSFCISTYKKGGEAYGLNTSGDETMIPLFDTSNEERDTVVKAHLSLDVKFNTAKTLGNLGVSVRNLETTILDNVINSYAHMMRMSQEGQDIICCQSNGVMTKLDLSNPL